MSITDLSATAIARMVQDRQLSASEVADAFCRRITTQEEGPHGLNAFIATTFDDARAQAAEIDRRIAAGEQPGPLAGVPVVVKDNINVLGQPLTCGSRILGRFISPYDATCIARLRAAGAVFIAKANMDEFAMGSSCEFSAFGPSRNPWDITRVPGGSSGGSAAAVAARYAPLSLGTDTGGSIRQPASYTGTVGVKPGYGRISRFGLVAFGSSLDQVGPFARTVEDAALAVQVMAGECPHDATSLRGPAPDLLHAMEEGGVAGLRVGHVPSHLGEGCDPAVASSISAVLNRLRAAGATLVELSMPLVQYSIHVYQVLATSEASANLSRFDGVRYGVREAGDAIAALYRESRGQGFGPEVKRRIMLGTFALSAGYQDAYYKHALRVRELMRRETAACFNQVDVIVGPAAPNTAFKLGANLDDPMKMYLCDIYTIGANLTGIPAMVVPCGQDGDGLPIGVQIQSATGEEGRMFGVAKVVESISGFTATPPTI